MSHHFNGDVSGPLGKFIYFLSSEQRAGRTQGHWVESPTKSSLINQIPRPCPKFTESEYQISIL